MRGQWKQRFLNHRFPQLRRVAPACAPEGAALNILFLSTLVQKNKRQHSGRAMQAHCAYVLLFRTVGTFPKYVISSF